jgi:hypothetical protein
MSRIPELEAILLAQYDLEGAPPHEKSARLKDMKRLFSEVLNRHNEKARAAGDTEITEAQFSEALGVRYITFKQARDIQMKQALHRLQSRN